MFLQLRIGVSRLWLVRSYRSSVLSKVAFLFNPLWTPGRTSKDRILRTGPWLGLKRADENSGLTQDGVLGDFQLSLRN
jgi:hypothetical protein